MRKPCQPLKRRWIEHPNTAGGRGEFRPASRKLAAILVTDIVGYSRLAGTDEERTLARLRALRSDLVDPTIALHHGRIVKRPGDGSIVEFEASLTRCAARSTCRTA